MRAVPGYGEAVSGQTDAGAVQDGPWRAELLNLVRAGSGGLLFGVPLLYTMEIWWTGTHTSPASMLVVLGALSLPVLALNMTAGFRARRDARLTDAVADTVEALAVGILVTAAVLVLLSEINGDTPLRAALGKVVYECVPVCLGIGVARHFLTGRRSGDDEEDDGPDGLADEEADSALSATVADLGATTVGAVFVSLSIAPTDEVPMITSALSPLGLLAIVAASLATSYAIVFVADFRSQEARHAQVGPFQRPISETVVSYLTSLAVAGLLLWLFQRGTDPPGDLLSRMIVLGFPAAIGGAAGKAGRVTTDRDPRTVAEWVTLVCASLILGVVVALIAAQLRGERDPAAPVAEITDIREVDDVHHVEVVIGNDGDETAAEVQVQAELSIDGETSEADQVIDFLAGGEEEHLVFVFEEDPAEGLLTVAVTGFAVP